MDREGARHRTQSRPFVVASRRAWCGPALGLVAWLLGGVAGLGCGSGAADGAASGAEDQWQPPPPEQVEVGFWRRDTGGGGRRDVARTPDARPDAGPPDAPPADDPDVAADVPLDVPDEPPPRDIGPPPPVDVRDYEREPILFGPGTPQPFAPTEDNASVVTLTGDGDLTLSQTHETIRFIWIANSADGTVSRLDTETGAEVGRYRICADPSRTSVDLDGDVWVGCRGDGSVVKIRQDADRCPDRDGNGSIETSRDLNGDGRIDPASAELLPQGGDECVLFSVAPYGSAALARAVAVSENGDAWVGFWNAHMVARFDAATGAVVQEIPVTGSPYGFALDRRGILWVSFREWTGGGGSAALGRIDPATGSVQAFHPGGCVSPYGIGVDRNGRVWLANFDCRDILVFHPDAAPPSFTRISLPALGPTRGVAASREGHVCVAHSDGSCATPSQNNQVTCLDDTTFAPTTIDLSTDGSSRGPVGVAFAADGRLWAVNQCGSSATRVDTVDRAVLGEYPVGRSPYTYSDMTGYSLRSQIDPEGWYQVSAEVTDPKFVGWRFVTVEGTTPPGSAIYLQVRSYRPGDDPSTIDWSPRFGPFPPEVFPFDLNAPEVAPYTAWSIIEVRVILAREEATAPPSVHRIALEYR